MLLQGARVKVKMMSFYELLMMTHVSLTTHKHAARAYAGEVRKREQLPGADEK